MFWFFGPEACGILAPRPGIEPAPPALEGEVLTTGPPGKSPGIWFLWNPSHLGAGKVWVMAIVACAFFDSGRGKLGPQNILAEKATV